MAKETAIAYGIEFYVGRRSRDRALSDVRAAGEMVNLQAAQSFKKGAAMREKLHATGVKKLRDSSKSALADLEKTRSKAAAGASKAFDAMKPQSAQDWADSQAIKPETAAMDEYRKKFDAI